MSTHNTGIYSVFIVLSGEQRMDRSHLIIMKQTHFQHRYIRGTELPTVKELYVLSNFPCVVRIQKGAQTYLLILRALHYSAWTFSKSSFPFGNKVVLSHSRCNGFMEHSKITLSALVSISVLALLGC